MRFSKRTLHYACAAMIALQGAALALDQNDLQWTGSASYEFGQVMKGRGAVKARTQYDSLLDHAWLQQALGNFGAKATLAPGLEMKLGFEFAYVFSYIQSANVLWQSSLTPDTRIRPTDLQGTYTLGAKNEGNWAQFAMGYFPFKYNSDVRNLGEYLFRTGTYPGYIMNDFDFPASRLLGFRISGGLSAGVFKAAGDALLTSETLYYPLQDFSPTFIGKLSVLDAVELGGGVCFNRLWSAKEEYTVLKSRPIIDSLNDTSYYTFAGTKVMGRIMLDPKRFFFSPESSIFGSNDLRFYAEIAFLGLKNYEKYYMDLKKRVPLVVGLNLPTLKLLDVCSFEWEWYRSDYPNSYERVYSELLPFPVEWANAEDASHKTDDDFKWSLYLKRSFFNDRLSVTGQVARDHLRLVHFQNDLAFMSEAITRKDHWHWTIKTRMGF